jgi:hypothetical protein
MITLALREDLYDLELGIHLRVYWIGLNSCRLRGSWQVARAILTSINLQYCIYILYIHSLRT